MILSPQRAHTISKNTTNIKGSLHRARIVTARNKRRRFSSHTTYTPISLNISRIGQPRDKPIVATNYPTNFLRRCPRCNHRTRIAAKGNSARILTNHATYAFQPLNNAGISACKNGSISNSS